MPPSFLLVFFTLFHPVLLYPTKAEEEAERFFKECPPFNCGNLGQIRYPFTNLTLPEYCGPLVVDGCDKKPKMQLVRESRTWYEVENISQINPLNITVTITDLDFQRRFHHKTCESFNNLSIHHPPGFGLQITTNLTLLKCNRTVKVPPPEFSYLGCKNFSIYYNFRNKSLPTNLPHNCSIVQLPVRENENYHDHDIFGLLNPTFSIQVVWEEEECYWCKKQGQTCQQNGQGKLQCVPTNQIQGSKKGLTLGLGIGVPATIIIILIAIACIWFRNKRKDASSNLLSANASADPNPKSDLESSTVYFGIPILSYSELEEATNNFDFQNELGDGGFGTVYYGSLRDGREVAVKRLYEHNYRRVQQFMNEIEILTRLRHKNLVSLYGCTSRHSRELLLVYEYIPNGTVAEHLHGDQAKSAPLGWPIRMRIAIETATALAYLHASEIIHRDVKANNILLDDNFCVKVADFGLSRLFPNDVTHVSTAPQGTPGYIDPEYHQCYQLTGKSDVYSFGVVLIELISSMPAVDITRHRHEINLASLAINKIQKGALDELIDPWLGYKEDKEVERMTTSVAELAFQCLQHDKEMRPSMAEVWEELVIIENGEYKSDNAHSNIEVLKNIKPTGLPPDSNNVTLVKNIGPLPSPAFVTDSGSSTISSISG